MTTKTDTSDRELLELAAKAAGLRLANWHKCGQDYLILDSGVDWPRSIFAPPASDADAFRLAVALDLEIYHVEIDGEMHAHVGYASSETGRTHYMIEPHGNDFCGAPRRAIVRVAAEMGRNKL